MLCIISQLPYSEYDSGYGLPEGGVTEVLLNE